ncbi:MAG: hypothetical protein HKP30_17485 [Myxococcales bacterium]|nr:hypothetical protein [Myxococcales bacterium]
MTLAESRRGLTIADICERYTVSRRTAERMRDAVAERFVLVEEARLDGDRRKRWRIDGRVPGVLVRDGGSGGHGDGISAADLAVLMRAAAALAELERPELSDEVARLVTRLRP